VRTFYSSIKGGGLAAAPTRLLPPARRATQAERARPEIMWNVSHERWTESMADSSALRPLKRSDQLTFQSAGKKEGDARQDH
jgi:hypothetical protein